MPTLCLTQFACPEQAAVRVIDHRARHRARKSPMTAACSLPRYGGALASGSATARLHHPREHDRPGPSGPALPVIYRLRQDRVSWPTQALAAQGGVGVPAIPRRLAWSTVMVHSRTIRPPWLDRKALQANGF
jgi:hypothetical protein